MSTQRLSFLYPQLYRSAQVGEAAATRFSTRRTGPSTAARAVAPPICKHCQRSATFATSATPRQSTFAPRVGKAVEPKPLGYVQDAPALEIPVETSKSSRPDAAEAKEPSATKAKPKSQEKEDKDAPSASKKRESTPEERRAAAEKLNPVADPKDTPKETFITPDDIAATAAATKAPATILPTTVVPSNPFTGSFPGLGNGEPGTQPQPSQDSSTDTNTSSTSSKPKRSGPMDAVLHIEPPESDKPPHLVAPPYVHHFDSYSLVKDLTAGGFTQPQAITTMKAVRSLLAQNLDVAQLGLVSKSDVENETYLFRAACSELGTEVKNTKRVREEGLRQQRTMLQYEMDEVTQSLNRELASLGENVRGMFDDRKMAVREEQKGAESAIQQINYKINVTLNSDSKSEIEAVRWLLARRAIFGILFLAFVSFGTLRYANYLGKRDKKLAEEAEKEQAARKNGDGMADRALAPDAVEILAAN